MQQEDKDLVALFEGLDTPGVSDAMDKLGLPGHCFGLVPLADYAGVTVGPAFTVKYVPASTPSQSVKLCCRYAWPSSTSQTSARRPRAARAASRGPRRRGC